MKLLYMPGVLCNVSWNYKYKNKQQSLLPSNLIPFFASHPCMMPLKSLSSSPNCSSKSLPVRPQSNISSKKKRIKQKQINKKITDCIWKAWPAQYASGAENFIQNLYSFLISLVVTSTSRPWLLSSFTYA